MPKLGSTVATSLPVEYVQAPPFCMQVELSEGCNLRCTFCGLNGIRGKQNDYKFMTLETANCIIDHLCDEMWLPRIEFAMHGEPSANPEMLDILAAFRRRMPKNVHLMMTSNGAGFVADPTLVIDTALEYLNVLALDWYDGIKLVPRIIEGYKGVHTPIYYPANKEGNPHKRRKPSEHHFVIVQDIADATKGNHATLNNHAGCGAPKNESANGKRCAKPFREMSIRWDGSVAVCCNDWRGQYKCGNINEQTLVEIWYGPEFVAARRKLYHGERTFGPCQGCDALSYRPGLLPDQYGKQSLPKATEDDEACIMAALNGLPYTLPVLRPWEVQ